ncbi:MAG TPA: glutathione S-transferase [Thermoleophilaceae bacterium]|jgi:glutathione S-transferase
MTERESPASSLVLWVLRRSVFCEKALWGLDHKGLEYRVRTVHPGLHPAELRVRGRGGTVPVLDVDGRSVRGSARVLAALEEVRPEPALHPEDPAARREAVELERFFDESCGHEVRRVTLDAVLDHPDAMLRAFMAGRSAIELRAARAAFPAVARMTRMRYGVDRERVEAAHRMVAAAFDEVESRAGSSGYLVGDSFSVADLAGAALLAPVVWPPEYPDPAWGDEGFRAALAELRGSFSGRPGFEWVLETYRRHRGQPAASPPSGEDAASGAGGGAPAEFSEPPGAGGGAPAGRAAGT